MSTAYTHYSGPRCPKGHPVDSPRCFLCEQEAREQERRDDEQLAALRRLVARGKLSKEILIGD